MRRFVIVCIGVGCSAPAPQPPSSKIGAVDAWTVDAKGPVANAEVRVVALAPARCACNPPQTPRDDGMSYGNEVPECACPAALAAWQHRLAQCAWPSEARQVVRTDDRGHAVLDAGALAAASGTSIEANGATGVVWLTPPARADRIALELSRASVLRLVVDTTAELHAALLFDDGHCMPFRRDGDRTWVTAAAVPHSDDSWPVLVVEAKGYATIARSWYESDSELALPLHRAQPVTDSCDGDEVTLDNAFQHLVARVDARKRFQFDGVLDTDSDLTCTKHGDVEAEWRYSPADGLQESGGVYGGLFGGSCNDVLVVDRAGRPIAGAEVSFNGTPSARFSMGGALTYTGAQGRACVEDVYAGGQLTAHAPLDRGGQCAGEAAVNVTQQMVGSPIRITLDVRPLKRSKLHGRVLSPEKIPIAGATISVRDVSPSQTPECSDRSDTMVSSAADGSFALPLLPQGRITLAIQHDWYTDKDVEITLPSRERELVLERGLTWTGHVLDPDGKNLDRCDLFLTLPNQRLLTAKCSAQGFSFGTLIPGEAKLSVRVEKHALGTFRTLEVKIAIAAGKPLVHDVQWPKGESIAGRVVDASGAPIAGARLTALPKGTRELSDRFAPGEVMLEADRDGRFTFRELLPGVWIIRGDRRASRQVTVELATGTSDARIVTTR
ncbi:MAG TPA: carboxypeptidase-like regulatory domain-containing protein [Kofleriaceae bacterium]